MRLNRFHLKDFFGQEKIELSDGPIFHQIKNVLRMKSGDRLAFFNKNKEAIYEVDIITDKKIALSMDKKLEDEELKKREIILFQSVIKGDKMDWVAQKATELGVTRIIPIISRRSEKKDINLSRLIKISIEASEQCGRRDLIDVEMPIKFEESIKNLEGVSFLGDSSGQDFLEIFLNTKDKDKNINVFIGPEGGFEADEIELARKNGVEVVKLNNHILRSETATVAFLTLISNL